MLNRSDIIERLRINLEKANVIAAAWLGGSDANGRADEFSDVDLFLIVEPGRIEDAAAEVEKVLAGLSPISRKMRVPFPTWHGFHQCFYQLERAPEWLMVDWLIIERDQKHPWLEIDRHGTPIVLFDKAGLVKPERTDMPATRVAIAKKVEEWRIKFPLFQHIPAKLVRRGLPADAAYFYNALTLRPLVDMLRAVHCPERHDFGFRYLKDDLPRELYEAVCRLSYFDEPERIIEHQREARSLFETAMTDWDARASV